MPMNVCARARACSLRTRIAVHLRLSEHARASPCPVFTMSGCSLCPVFAVCVPDWSCVQGLSLIHI
eukprot:9480160-Alexandrium_andersonii.AAC.1